ncbi:MAG: ATP-binding protein [Ignavibacteriaceae bacterium]|jgi:hypothetical protein|nr:ATP-binding protein [Ignavibacteriaceae bacterium]
MEEITPIRKYLEKTELELYQKLIFIKKHVELVLARVPATFPEYTEHGWNHALNVEKLAYTLFGDRLFEILSAYELFILVNSCWFHDIGMVGSVDEDPETVRLQHPLRSNKYLLDHYSELNIARHEASVIGKICKSHWSFNIDQNHEEILVKEKTVKLRLLCAILGLSDICDVTADRAPEIVYNIIKPGPESDLFWKTHLDIGGLNKNENGNIWLTAEYKSSNGKQLIENIVNAIEEELKVIYPTIQKYDFNIQPVIISQIDPIDPKLSDISFQKNLHAQNILEILTKSLYKNKNVFVRELLQNAIDACKIKDTLKDDSESYTPSVRIFIHGNDNIKFDIEDNGVGMDLHDIETQLSVPGAKLIESYDLRSLPVNKRQKLDALIARFGIGFLSCFLCCDKIEIETKKNNSNPLRFVISDLYTKYGFLESSKESSGTIIRATLKKEYNNNFLVDAVKYYYKGNNYVSEIQNNCVGMAISNLVADLKQKKYTIEINEIDLEGILTLDPNSQNKLMVCQEGILINEHMGNMLPTYSLGIVGFINVVAGVIDLTTSRFEIEENEKFIALKVRIEKYIQLLINKSLDNINEKDDSSQKSLLNHLLLMSSLTNNYTNYLSNLFLTNYKYETLYGEMIKLTDLLENKEIYYYYESSSVNTKRCRWLNQFIYSKIDFLSNFKSIDIPTKNILYISYEIPATEYFINLVENFLNKNGIRFYDLGIYENLRGIVEYSSIDGGTESEIVLRKNGIIFSSIQDTSNPVIDLGSPIILNLANESVSFVYNRMIKKTDKSIRHSSLAYFFMLAQRFDLAHKELSLVIDINKPPFIEHGHYKPTEYDALMHKTQKLYYDGLYTLAIEIMQKYNLQGSWADKLRTACIEKMNGDSK